MSVFNLGSGKNTKAKGLVPGVDYVVVKDGNQNEYHILNIDNEKWMPTTGIVEFVPLKTTKRHINNINVKVYRDAETGLLVGIPDGVSNKDKQIIWRNVNLLEAAVFDLSIPAQRAEAIMISRSPFVKGSPNFRYGCKTPYRKVDKEAEAEEFVKTRKTKRDAEDIAMALSGQNLLDMAYAIGKDPKFMSPMMVFKEVVTFAEKEPKRFLEIYGSENRQALVIVKRGLATGVLLQNVDRGITYNGVSFGFSEEEAVEYLKKNPHVQASIDIQAKKKEDANNQNATETYRKEAATIVDEKDAQIELMKQQLEKLMREKEAATKIATELISENVLASEDPEFAELLAEAKKLGVKGAHLVKDKEKLRGKVEAIKAEVAN